MGPNERKRWASSREIAPQLGDEKGATELQEEINARGTREAIREEAAEAPRGEKRPQGPRCAGTARANSMGTLQPTMEPGVQGGGMRHYKLQILIWERRRRGEREGKGQELQDRTAMAAQHSYTRGAEKRPRGATGREESSGGRRTTDAPNSLHSTSIN